ncbi:MAG: hypothetical protein H6702_09080 [Myxococcales bacterium]|nr:hypothetical protein [Myxococcales bacterium]
MGPPPTPSEAVTANPDERQVDTLLLTLDLRVPAGLEGPLGAHADASVDPAHVVAVALEVDGQPWGRFAVAPQAASAPPVAGWRLLPEPRSLLLVAHLTDDVALVESPPDDVRAWLSVLDRTLAAGDHVARVAEVILEDAGGRRVALSFSHWLPFHVARGDASAHVGALTLTAHGLDAAEVIP